MTFFRYIIIQLSAYIIDMGVFWFVINMMTPEPVFGNMLSKLMAGIFALFAHRNFTFKVNKKIETKKLALKYFLLLALNIPISSVILVFVLFFVEWPIIAKVISDVLYFVANYFLCKFYIFSSKNKDALSLYLTGQLVEK